MSSSHKGYEGMLQRKSITFFMDNQRRTEPAKRTIKQADFPAQRYGNQGGLMNPKQKLDKMVGNGSEPEQSDKQPQEQDRQASQRLREQSRQTVEEYRKQLKSDKAILDDS